MSDEYADLRVRVERLEAVEEIRKLQQSYAGYCDEGYLPDKIADLFVEDAEFDGGKFGSCRGKAGIADFYKMQGENIPWALHYMIGDSITVSDDLETATGTWYLFSPLSTDLGGGTSATWVMGRYVDQYKKVDGEWKFAKVEFTVDVATPAVSGWYPDRIAVA